MEVAIIAKKAATKKEAKKKFCTACRNELPLSKFYLSKSPLHSLDGKTPICKDCAINNSLNEDTGEIDEVKLKNILRQLDKPFYLDNLVSAENQYRKENGHVSEEDVKYHGSDILRIYFKNCNSLRQLVNKTYSDSEKDGFIQKNSSIIKKNESTSYSKKINRQINDEVVTADEGIFEVTQDMIDMFGEGYTRLEYKKMRQKYDDMTKTYVVQTNLHKEALLTYVRFKVKEEIATSKGDVQEAQKWYQAAQDAAEKAKLTPKQLSKEDLQGGLVNFSDIFAAVEGAKERIAIFPEFKYQPKDAADFIIWCYINYERNLNNLPEVEYSEIYKFYDRKKQEYVDTYGDPYGIFTEDTTEINRDTVEKFITVPKEFKDGE